MDGDEPLNLIDRPGRELERQIVQVGAGPAIAYVEVGQGSPVVLIHGVLTTLEDMTLGLSDALAPVGRVVAVDRPGSGHSEMRRFVDAGLWRQADRLHEALDRLGIERPVLVGHSFGASVAVAMAVARPEAVAGVVALAPLVRPEARLEHILFGPRAPAILGDLAGYGSGPVADRALLPVLWRAMFLPQSMPSKVLDAFPFALAGRTGACVRVGEDALATPADLLRVLALCGRCPVPMRIFGGDRDLVVRNGVNGRLLAELMPNAEFIDLPGLGHMIHHFAADRIAAAVAELTEPARAVQGAT